MLSNMGCLFRARANALWSIWYCLFTMTIFCYLLYIGFTRYPSFTVGHLWPRGGRPDFYLTLYLVLHGAVIGLSLFFVASALFKVGNMASDNEKMGEPAGKRVLEVQGSCCKFLRSVWRHAPPVAQTVHLMMVMCLLLAHTFIQTELFRHGLIGREYMWNMGPLEFLFTGQSGLLQIKYSNLTYHVRPSPFTPPILPTQIEPAIYGVSLDFTLFLLGLVMFAILYPAVFTRVSKCFSCLFSFQLLVHGIDAVCSFLGFALLFRLHRMDEIKKYQHDATGLHQLLTPKWLVVDYLATAAVCYLSSALVYSYGYGRYCIAVHSTKGQLRVLRPRCDGYLPNGAAIIMLVLLVVCKAPVFYDLLMLTQRLDFYKQVKLLVCIAASVLFLFTWLIIWLMLTLRRDWGFKPGVLVDVPQITEPGTVLVVAGKERYLTDDPSKRAAILSLVDKAHRHDTDVYWLKPDPSGTKPSPHVNHVGLKSASANQSPVDERRDLQFRQVRQGSLDSPSKPIRPGGPDWSKYDSFRRQHVQIAGAEPAEVRKPLVTRGGSGSYIRYSEEAVYDPVPDAITTFGTMPRGSERSGSDFYRRRRMQQQQMVASDVSSHPTVAYAQVVKKTPSPAPGGVRYQRVPVDAEPGIIMVDDNNISRASSYSNVPPGHARGQGSWDGGSSVGSHRQQGAYPQERNASYASIQQGPNQGRASYSPETLVIPRSPGPQRHYDPYGRPPQPPPHQVRMASFDSREQTPQADSANNSFGYLPSYPVGSGSTGGISYEPVHPNNLAQSHPQITTYAQPVTFANGGNPGAFTFLPPHQQHHIMTTDGSESGVSGVSGTSATLTPSSPVKSPGLTTPTQSGKPFRGPPNGNVPEDSANYSFASSADSEAGHYVTSVV